MSHNTWIHRIARVAVVRPLMNTGIAPNHLTTGRLLLGVGGAGLIAWGSGPWAHMGAAVFLISMILDRADGDFARVTGQTSSGGHIYDLVADMLSNAALFVGLGIGESDGPLGPWAIAIGVAAGVSVAVSFAIVVSVEREGGERAAELPPLAGFDADDAMLLVPLGIWLGWSGPVLIAAGIGAPLFALFFVVRFHRQILAWLAFQRGRAEAGSGGRHPT